jgi:RimJ/RimL family protein N-acetyltransferase
MYESPVKLRALRDGDSPRLYEWIIDRSLRTMNAPYRPISEAQHRAWFNGICQRQDVAIFMIDEVATGSTIGTCQLRNIDNVSRSAELQIRIGDAQHHNKGLGTAAVARLVQFGFEDLNLRRISLQVFMHNGRAIRVYEKSGFVVEGRLREAAYVSGQWLDIVCMGILRERCA